MALKVEHAFGSRKIRRKGKTPLMKDAEAGREVFSRLSITAKKCDLNSQDSQGWSALMWACGRSEGEVNPDLLDNHQYSAVKAILNNGADPNLADDDGHTPLMQAAARGWNGVCKLLLAYGANPILASKSGETALKLATSNNHGEVADTLSPEVLLAIREKLAEISNSNAKDRRIGSKPKI